MKKLVLVLLSLSAMNMQAEAPFERVGNDVADWVEATYHDLDEKYGQQLRTMRKEFCASAEKQKNNLEDTIKKHPIESIMVAGFVGCVIPKVVGSALVSVWVHEKWFNFKNKSSKPITIIKSSGN